MRTAAVALAASAILMGAEAGSLLRRHAHHNAHKRDYAYDAPEPETCKVVTYTTWVPYNPPKPTYETTAYETTEYVKSTVTVVPTPHTTVPYTCTNPVPTPDITTCPTPGTYTFPAKTVTLTATETICVPTTAVLTPGCTSYGHTTTVVDKQTVVTCPLATTYTSGTAVYTTLTSTIFECPTPGTYTYGGHSTSVTKTVTVTYPMVTTYCPGTYTAPLKTVTVTEKDFVYTCPYGSYVPPPPPTSTAKPIPVPVVYTQESVKPTPVPTPETYEVEKPKPKPSKAVIDYNTVGQGKQWCITYTQYNDDKSCKSPEAIDADLYAISQKGFRSIRIYAPDCDALQAITSSCKKHGLKIVMGVFIRGSNYGWDKDDVYKQVQTLIEWKEWDITELIVIGNESVWGQVISPGDLVALIASCKQMFKDANYPGKVTTSEVVSTLEATPELCTVVDVVAVNIQPFFNGGYAADAGKFIKQQMAQAKAVCGLPTYCLEAGWPSAGEQFGNAIAGEKEQMDAITSIYAIDDGHISYFTTSDDGWKEEGKNGGVERHFGCSKLFPIGGSAY